MDAAALALQGAGEREISSACQKGEPNNSPESIETQLCCRRTVCWFPRLPPTGNLRNRSMKTSLGWAASECLASLECQAAIGCCTHLRGRFLLDPMSQRMARIARGVVPLGAPGVDFLLTHRGVSGYVDPRPLLAHGPHHHVLRLFALDTHLDFASITERGKLRAAVAGYVPASGALTGTRAS